MRTARNRGMRKERVSVPAGYAVGVRFAGIGQDFRDVSRSVLTAHIQGTGPPEFLFLIRSISW